MRYPDRVLAGYKIGHAVQTPTTLAKISLTTTELLAPVDETPNPLPNGVPEDQFHKHKPGKETYQVTLSSMTEPSIFCE